MKKSMYRIRLAMPHIALVDGFWRVTNPGANWNRKTDLPWVQARNYCHKRNVKEGRSES